MLVVCAEANCDAKHRPHHMCQTCGFYNGRMVIDMQAKADKREARMTAKKEARKGEQAAAAEAEETATEVAETAAEALPEAEAATETPAEETTEKTDKE